jgi:hypothetical protein
MKRVYQSTVAREKSLAPTKLAPATSFVLSLTAAALNGYAVEVRRAVAKLLGGEVVVADIVQVRLDEVVEVVVRRRLSRIVEVGVQLLVVATAHLLRREKTEVLDQLEVGLRRLQVLQRLVDQRRE